MIDVASILVFKPLSNLTFIRLSASARLELLQGPTTVPLLPVLVVVPLLPGIMFFRLFVPVNETDE